MLSIQECNERLTKDALKTVKGIVCFMHMDGKIVVMRFNACNLDQEVPEWITYALLHKIEGTLAGQVCYGFN